MTRTALVTGGAGFIGSHLVQRLIGAGWHVIVVDDLSGMPQDESVKYKAPDGVTFRNSPVQSSWIDDRVDAVFHLAGKVGPTGVLRYPGRIAQDTILGAARAADWAFISACPLIDVSTSEVYGSPDAANTEDTPAVFQPRVSARKEYAVSKLAAETMLLNRPTLDVRIIRPFNVTGPGQRPDGGFVLPRFVIQSLGDNDITVYRPGTQKRAFTHVTEIVDGIMLAYEKGEAGQVYNLGNANNACSIEDLAFIVMNRIGKGRVKFVDPQAIHGPAFVEAPEKIPDATKAEKELGWRPSRGIHQIVNEVVDFYKKKFEEEG